MQDNLIGEDKLKFELSGGCTACVSLFIHGKLYLANAGDSRGVLSLNSLPHPMSFDFTPESETQRIRKLVRFYCCILLRCIMLTSSIKNFE